MTRQEAADYLGISSDSLAQMATRGTGPRYAKLSGRMTRYRIEDLDAWIEAHLVESTARWP